jgi:hypothetical protein
MEPGARRRTLFAVDAERVQKCEFFFIALCVQLVSVLLRLFYQVAGDRRPH